MKVGHKTIMASHLGPRKTTDRIMTNFYWPGIQSDVKRYCRSCDICQKTMPKGRTAKVPLGQMPLIEVPFQRVAVDIVGPIHPITEKGNRYILTMVDYATRYPEAVPLPSIEAERVAEALVEVFTRVGVPSEILTDRGTQFTSGVMGKVSRLLTINGVTSDCTVSPLCRTTIIIGVLDLYYKIFRSSQSGKIETQITMFYIKRKPKYTVNE